MAYMLEIADALARTIGKFKTLNSYQLAGQAANFDFWKGQVKNALDVIDGYPARRKRLTAAQKNHIREHDTRRFLPKQLSPQQKQENQDFPEDAWPLDRAMHDPQLIDPAELQAKRRDVVDAFYTFLLRCHKEGLLTTDVAKQSLAECGVGVEPGDFRD